MSSQTRTLLLLMLLALGGVTVLSMMARRYGEVLEQRAETGAAASGRLDAFVEARRAMHAAIGANATPLRRAELGESMRRARDGALDESGLAREDYRTLRERYRRWRLGRSGDPDLDAAFRERAAVLREIDLGDYESLDVD